MKAVWGKSRGDRNLESLSIFVESHHHHEPWSMVMMIPILDWLIKSIVISQSRVPRYLWTITCQSCKIIQIYSMCVSAITLQVSSSDDQRTSLLQVRYFYPHSVLSFSKERHPLYHNWHNFHFSRSSKINCLTTQASPRNGENPLPAFVHCVHHPACRQVRLSGWRV